eukprot:TRINITY_DN33148_c0_g1_i1.p1 TRINITY_DN33148_c0_g1~~TRINITY_DN33148_c0_g1_i1.p1  ORF type:complete len:209 (-),score=16.90 TRINITY_DN33148_c0_g1_i1:296-922(-)
MAIRSSFIVACSAFVLLLLFPLSSCKRSSAYEQLISYGLPPNLLPDTVVDYTLDDAGYFEVYLTGDCYSSVKNGEIPVFYSQKITGSLSYARLSSLKGVYVRPPKYGFFWLRVVTIYVDGEEGAQWIHVGVGLGIQEAVSMEDFASTMPVCEGEVTWSEWMRRLLTWQWSSTEKPGKDVSRKELNNGLPWKSASVEGKDDGKSGVSTQ